MSDELREIFERLGEIDAVPDQDFVAALRDEITLVASAPASSIVREDELMEPTMIDILERQTDTVEQKSRRGWLAAAAAVILIVVGLAGAIAISSDDDDGGPVGNLESLTDETALGATQSYFDSSNAGDSGAVLALLAPNVFIEDNFVGGWALSAWELALEWDAAKGTQVVDIDCAVESVETSLIIVRCTGELRGAIVQAVDTAGVPTRFVLSWTREGLAGLSLTYGSPDFDAMAGPFERWMNENHPENADLVGFQDWTSVEHARSSGAARASFAAGWAAFLADSGCSPTQAGTAIQCPIADG